MKNYGYSRFAILAIIVILSITSCSHAAPTPTLTATPVPPTNTIPPPTDTIPAPTATRRPTSTPWPTRPSPTITLTVTPPGPTITPIPTNVKLGIDIPIRIMPLGDSITEGLCDSAKNCDDRGANTPVSGGGGVGACSWNATQYNPNVASYRVFLRDQLLAKGIKITYVGSISLPDGQAHEGHSGFTISDLDFCIQNAGWLYQAQPNMILLHIGTNDVWDTGLAKAPDKLSLLLEHIYAQLPETTYVIVAQIIPMNSDATGENGQLAQYNAKIPAVVDRFRKQGKNVFSVDMWGAIQSNADLYDGLHPAPAALERMATIWYNKIVEILTPKP
jgi:lysophospholipase L1-like esterase